MASEIVFYDHEWVAVTETWVNPGIRRSAYVATHAERGQCGLTGFCQASHSCQLGSSGDLIYHPP